MIVLRRLPGVALTVVLVAAVVGLGGLLAARLLGYEPLVVRSGSMEGAIHTGSLVLVGDRPSATIEVGDVAVVDPPGGAAPRLHRVIERFHEHGRVLVQTKGDANETPDADVVALPDEVATPVFVIPVLGYLFAALSTRAGLLVVSTTIVAIIGASVLWAMWRPSSAPA